MLLVDNLLVESREKRKKTSTWRLFYLLRVVTVGVEGLPAVAICTGLLHSLGGPPFEQGVGLGGVAHSGGHVTWPSVH